MWPDFYKCWMQRCYIVIFKLIWRNPTFIVWLLPKFFLSLKIFKHKISIVRSFHRDLLGVFTYADSTKMTQRAYKWIENRFGGGLEPNSVHLSSIWEKTNMVGLEWTWKCYFDLLSKDKKNYQGIYERRDKPSRRKVSKKSI